MHILQQAYLLFATTLTLALITPKCADATRNCADVAPKCADATRNSYRATSCRSALADNEAAVDFVCQYDHTLHDSVYAAFVITRQSAYYARIASVSTLHNHRSSRFVTLLRGITSTGRHDMVRTDRNTVYRDSTLADLIWQPIMQSLPSHITTVYFAPTGILRLLAIEYLPSHYTANIEIRRLTSIAGLEHRHASPTPPHALVIGNLDYNRTLTPTDTVLRRHDAVRALARHYGSGWRFTPLTNSLDEIRDIADAIHADTIVTDCTEQQFASLIASYNMLHISTHAYTLPSTSSNDDALNLSALVLTGANHAHTTPYLDDQLLTAHEISQLNLTHLQFVALAACQTALATNCEQASSTLLHAFKTAGARTILASLWSVNDQATKLFMHTFYTYIASGLPYHSALRHTQHDFQHSQQYYLPYYWAAFVLVDDLTQ